MQVVLALILLGVLSLHSTSAWSQNSTDVTAVEPKAKTESTKKLPRREDRDETLLIELGFYEQDDDAGNSGGNPDLDEDMTVYEGIIMLDKPLTERDRLNVRVLGDIVSSASQTRNFNPAFRALQSNPSGNRHGEISAAWMRDYKKFKLSHNASIGAEWSNYFSFGYGSKFVKSFWHDNLTFAFNLQGVTDYFQIKLFNGQEPGYDVRQTWTFEPSLTQVLSPKTVAQLVINHTQQHGFLETSFNSVFVNGVEFTEEVPTTRRRDSVTLRLKQAFTELNSVELGYRFYDDSWDIQAHTGTARYYQYVFGKRLLLEPNYRFYTQTEAFFFQRTFTSLPQLRTQDPDIGDFTGHIIGVKVGLNDPPFLRKWSRNVYVSYSRYFRDDNLNIYWITTGYTATF